MKNTKIVLIGLIIIVLVFSNIADAKQIRYAVRGDELIRIEKGHGEIKRSTFCKNAVDSSNYNLDMNYIDALDGEYVAPDEKYFVFEDAAGRQAPARYFLFDSKKCRVVRELEAQYSNDEKECSVAFSPDSKKMYIKCSFLTSISPANWLEVTKEYSGPDFTNKKILKNMPSLGRAGAAENSDSFWVYDYKFTQDGKFLLTDYPVKSVWTIKIYDIAKDRIIASFPDSRVLFPNEKVYWEDDMPNITEGYLLFNFVTPHGTRMVIFNYRTKKVVSEINSAEKGLGSFSGSGSKIIFSTFPNKITWQRNVIIYDRRTGSLLGQAVLDEQDDIVDVSPHATKLIYKEHGLRKTIRLRKPTMASLSFASQSASKITYAEYRQYLEASGDLKKADNDLNTSYKELMPVLQPDERQILILSQREWIKTRDEEAFKAAPKGTAAYIGALAKITYDRAAELKSRIHNAVNPFAKILQNKLSDAIYKNDLARVKALIAKGADVNGKDSWGRPPLVVVAIYNGKPEIAKLLLEKGANINSKDAKNRTALIWSLFEFNPDVAKLLLDRGADATAVDDDGYTALMGAAQAGALDITELLIKKGAKVNAKVTKHDRGQEPYAVVGHTALMWAVQYSHKDEARLLIAKGANVKATDNDGYTALMGAARNGYTDLVELMIKKGADVNAKDKLGLTPLMLALGNRHMDTVRLLLDRGADVNAKDDNGRTVLMRAVSDMSNADIVKLLLEKGANVNAMDNNGNMALDITTNRGWPVKKRKVQAVGRGHAGLRRESQNPIALMLINAGAMQTAKDRLFQAAKNGNLKKIKALIRKGADVNATDESGNTALIDAVSAGQLNAAKLLISAGADVNAVNDSNGNGITPLIAAVSEGRVDIAELLIKNGAKVNAKNRTTALTRAAMKGKTDVVQFLIKKGAHINEKDSYGMTTLIWSALEGKTDIAAFLIQRGAHINVEDNRGYTALMYAARNGRTDTVKLLIARGANVNAKSENGDTALSLAEGNAEVNVNHGNEIVQIIKAAGAKEQPANAEPLSARFFKAIYKNDLPGVQALLASGVDVNIRYKNGKLVSLTRGFTALMYAIEYWKTDIAKLLINKGADVNAKTKLGLTALMIAAGRGEADITKLLISKGSLINAKMSSGTTALIFAAFRGEPATTKLLLQNGADVNAKNNNGETALMISARWGHIEFVRILIEHGANVNDKDKRGRTALNFADEKDHKKIIQILKAAGAKEYY